MSGSIKNALRAAPPVALIAFFAALGLGEGLAQGVFGALVAACLTGAAVHPAPKELLPPRAPALLLLAYGIWALLTVVMSRYGAPRSSEWTKLYNLLPLVFVPIALALSPPSTPARAVLALCGALALSSIFGVIQHRYGSYWGADLFRKVPEWRRQVPAPNDSERYVAGGFFFHRLRLAMALVAAISLAAFSWQTISRKLRALLALCLGLMVVGLLLSYARAATVALLIGVLLAALTTLENRRALATIVALGVSAVGLAALIPGTRERLVSVFESGAYADRLFLWQRALEIIADHPWLGIGYGNYARVCGSYYDKVDPSFAMRSEAHNQLLTVLAQTGPLGLGLFVCLFGGLAVVFWQRARAGDSWARGALAAWIAFFTAAMFHDPLFHPSISLAFTAVFGMGLVRKPVAG